MFGGELADGGEHCGIDCACIEEESAEDFEDARFVGGVEGGRVIRQGGELCFGPIIGTLPRMW